MSAHGTEARVYEIPTCDFCKGEFRARDAVYDGRTAYGWAYMCQQHWDEHGPGTLGIGHGQRLVLSREPEPDPDCVAAEPSIEDLIRQDLNDPSLID